MKRLRILIACERSGVIRRAFRALGHDAWSCDLHAADDSQEWHVQSDALRLLSEGVGVPHAGAHYLKKDSPPWHLVITHPPCTRLALSGALRLYRDGKKANGRDASKWEDMVTGAKFFRAFFDLFHGPLCAENPTMHGHALDLILPLPGVTRQTIQPHEFGDDASKATVLWLRRLPVLMPSHVSQDFFAAEPPAPRIVGGLPRYANQTDSGQNKLAPSPTRAAARAVTYAGVAQAMAQQWGEFLSR
jgi:hypothetical protein